MTRQAEWSRTYRRRHPERQRAYRRLAMAKKRGATPERLIELAAAIDASPLALCPVCGNDYRAEHGGCERLETQ